MKNIQLRVHLLIKIPNELEMESRPTTWNKTEHEKTSWYIHAQREKELEDTQNELS
jgi:hypothetical protein